jgi:hypothetical protein
MLELIDNSLVFRFPEVHEDAVCKITFQRTLRIPDDNRTYDLPPGLGHFPLEHTSKHSANLPDSIASKGGVLLPMYQAEALWISFSSPNDYPFAIKITAGKINAVTGEPWVQGIKNSPQDYVAIPSQRWLDGFCVGEGIVRQFVAMPLGQGYTAEEQITGKAENGGIQVAVAPMKRSDYVRMVSRHSGMGETLMAFQSVDSFEEAAYQEISETKSTASPMGLAPGGVMKQYINQDEHSASQYDQVNFSRCFVNLLNSAGWTAVTGKQMPTRPVTAQDYSAAGLPWFSYYDEKATAVPGSKTLGNLSSVAAKHISKEGKPLPGNAPINPTHTIHIHKNPNQVKDGNW